MKTQFAAASILALAFVAMPVFAQEGMIRNQKELRSALAAAKTPADHARIAYYYHSAARTFSQSQAGEEAIAAKWQKLYEGWTKTPNPYQSAKSLAAWYEKQAVDAQSRASEQEKLANSQMLSQR